MTIKTGFLPGFLLFGEKNEKFIKNKGTGIHHVCLEVDSISQAIIELEEKNVVLINNKPKIGAEGYKIVFIHPKSTGGVLVELAEKPK